MKKSLLSGVVTVTVLIVCCMVLPISAMAADKLIVMDSSGTNEVFKVTDTGQISLPISTGTGRGVMFENAAIQDNFPSVAAYPDGTTSNAGISYQIIPKGTGYNPNIRAQLSVFGTDLNADNTNYEALVLRATGSAYSINATNSGTGQARPIYFQMSNTTEMAIDTSGKVGIGTTTPTISGTGKLHIAGDTIRLDTPRTPSSSSEACNTGEISWDSGYVYVCVATNTWKRAALSSF